MDRIYLTLDDVLWIHEDQLRRYGSASGVRDEGLTLSALLRPQTGYYADVIEEAAASRFHRLKQARGVVSTVIFLNANGATPVGAEEDWITFICSNIEARRFRKPVVEDWLMRHAELSR